VVKKREDTGRDVEQAFGFETKAVCARHDYVRHTEFPRERFKQRVCCYAW